MPIPIVPDMNGIEHSIIRSALNSEVNPPNRRPVIVRIISASDSESMAAIEEEENTMLNGKKVYHDAERNTTDIKEETIPSSSIGIVQRQSCSHYVKKSDVQVHHVTSRTDSCESSSAKSTPEEILSFTRKEHRDFVAAILDIGVKNCSPTVLLELLRNEGGHTLTREIMKSKLQKYRKIQDRGKGDFLAYYDHFQRKLEKHKMEHVNHNNNKGTAINGSDRGEMAIKKALRGRRPMNLVGGEVASLVSFAVANDCHENTLSSLNCNKVEVPILTEAEKNSDLGRALTSIAGLLNFTKDQLQKSRKRAPIDSARIHQVASTIAGQEFRRQQHREAHASSVYGSASSTGNSNNNNTAHHRPFPTRRMSYPQTHANSTFQQSVGRLKRRHSTMSVHPLPNFSQGAYQPPAAASAPTSTAAPMGFHQFYGNPTMPPPPLAPAPMLWEHRHGYQQHPTNNIMPPVHSVVYHPQYVAPTSHHHQHAGTVHPPASAPSPPHGHWSYHHQRRQQWETSSSPGGLPIAPNHNQRNDYAKMQPSYPKHQDVVTSSNKSERSRESVKERLVVEKEKSPNVYDYLSDLEQDEMSLHRIPTTKRRKRSHHGSKASSLPHGALIHQFSPSSKQQQTTIAQNDARPTYDEHPLEGKMADFEPSHDDAFALSASREFYW